MNGRMYGNLEGLEICKLKTAAWHVLSDGDVNGLHVFSVSGGDNLLIEGVNVDAHVSVSGMAYTGIMEATNVGMYLY